MAILLSKDNGYQSLHTTVIGMNGSPVEFQIRTKTMHENADKGIAAHWRYKEGVPFDNDIVERVRKGLRDLLEIHKDAKDAGEFISLAKINLFSDDVRTFTPKGDIITLPKGSSPLDFAYAISNDVGDRAEKFLVNGVERTYYRDWETDRKSVV